MIEATGNRVIAVELEHGERQFGNIVIADDDGKLYGIRPRWCKVYKVGPDVTGLNIGQWILVKHGRWSYKFQDTMDDNTPSDFWVIDYPKSVLMTSEEKPNTWNYGKEM